MTSAKLDTHTFILEICEIIENNGYQVAYFYDVDLEKHFRPKVESVKETKKNSGQKATLLTKDTINQDR